MQLPSTQGRVLKVEGEMASAEYSIDQGQIAHLMWVLRTGLYTRKALAVLREYSANGWDAMRSIGKFNTPLDIHIPTHTDPVVKIRDYGPGLSVKETLYTYTSYGASTKRGADPNCPECGPSVQGPGGDRVYCSACEEAHERAKKEVGALGIGSKSAYCISDSFTVTSWHGGYKRIFSSALDESNKGKMILLHEEECDPEDTGVEVQVPCPSDMVGEFQREARELFRFMAPRPNINIDLPELPEGIGEGWIHDEKGHSHDWIGVMGCIPYRLNTEIIQDELREAGVYEAVEQLQGGIHIPIGDVDFAANREELQYTSKTKAVLAGSIKDLLEAYFHDCLAALDDTTRSGWDRRAKGLFLTKRLRFPVPKKYDAWTAERVHLWVKEKGEKPKSFRLLSHGGESVRSIPINIGTTILIHDDPVKRAFKGWDLRATDVVVVPNDSVTEAEARAELEATLLAKACDGVHIASLMDSRPWYAPQTAKSRYGTSNAKHRHSVFRMTGTDRGVRALSQNWEIAEPPEDAHIYFIINGFKVRGSDEFYGLVNRDRDLARELGLHFPADIYGYKSTQKSPVKHDDIEEGTSYYKWRRDFFTKHFDAKRQGIVRDILWSEVFDNLPWGYKQVVYQDGKHVPDQQNWKAHHKRILATCADRLGDKHSLTRFLHKPAEAKARLKAVPASEQAVCRKLVHMIQSAKDHKMQRTAVECHFDRLRAAYPMLSLGIDRPRDFAILTVHMETILQYIAVIDGAQT